MASLAPKTGTLGRRLAAHFLRRTTYNPSISRINAFADMTAAQAVSEILRPVPDPVVPEPIDPETGFGWINTGRDTDTGEFNLKRFVCSWWLEEARRDPTINHKMIFFLHTNFSTSWEDDGNSKELFDHLALLKFYSLGNIKTLSFKITLDKLMLLYLDNRHNNKYNPNENYAREFLELFTIGKGPQIGEGNYTNYTEYDIQQAARVLTGFTDSEDRGDNIDPDTNLPTGRIRFNRHDTEDKVFSEAFGQQVIVGAKEERDAFRELGNFVDMVFNQDETARFICRKLYRFFVGKNITQEIENDIINPLAQTLINNQYELRPTLEQLFLSQHFFDEDDGDPTDEILGSLVKSPLDLFLHAINFFELDIPDPQNDPENHYDRFYRRAAQDIIFDRAGFSLFRPPSVAGYPAYYQEPGFGRNWFSTNTIITRYKLPEMLLRGRRVLSGGNLGGVQLDIVDFVRNSGYFPTPEEADSVVRTFVDYMLCESPDQQRYDYFLNEIFLDGLSDRNWFFEWQKYLDSGDDSDVKIPLSNLITAIMYSPEYQLF